jgi:hypothetical protein
LPRKTRSIKVPASQNHESGIGLAVVVGSLHSPTQRLLGAGRLDDVESGANIAVRFKLQVWQQLLFGMLEHIVIAQVWRMMFQELASRIGVGKLNHIEDGKLLSSNFNLLSLELVKEEKPAKSRAKGASANP